MNTSNRNVNSAQQPSTSTSNMETILVERSIRVPKRSKSFGLMKFTSKVDLDDVEQAQLKPVIVQKESTETPSLPEYGAGSKFPQSNKFVRKARSFEKQSYVFKTKASNGTLKKYKSMQEGVSENSVYYVLMNDNNGQYLAYPLDEWHTFRPVQLYNFLNDDEVETEFKKNNKGGGRTIGGMSQSNKLEKSISESEDDSDDDKKVGKGARKLKSSDLNSDEEAFDDGDEGDKESKECDYIGDTSDDSDFDSLICDINDDKATESFFNSDEEDADEFDNALKRKVDKVESPSQVASKKIKKSPKNVSTKKSTAKKSTAKKSTPKNPKVKKYD